MGRWSKRGVRGGWAIAIRNKILVERINSYNFVTRFQREGNSFFFLSLLFFSPPSIEAGIFAANIFAWPCINSRASAGDHCRRNYGHFARCAKLFRHSCLCYQRCSDFSRRIFFFPPIPFRNNIFDGRISNDFLLQLNLSPFYFLSSFFKFPSLRK